MQPVKKLFFDRLAELKGAVETSNANLSAYIGTVRFAVCSKSKHLAQQAFRYKGIRIVTPLNAAHNDIEHESCQSSKLCVLTFGSFFDALKKEEPV